MSEMAKRMAEAMKQRRRELIAQPLDRIWEDLAHAALEALEEPSAEMLKAGGSRSLLRGGFDPAGTWKLMIDAA